MSIIVSNPRHVISKEHRQQITMLVYGMYMNKKNTILDQASKRYKCDVSELTSVLLDDLLSHATTVDTIANSIRDINNNYSSDLIKTYINSSGFKARISQELLS